jgi:hypothetical protein
MVSNRVCAAVLLVLCGVFGLSQLFLADVLAIRVVVGTPLLLLGPGWAIMRFFRPGLGLFDAVVAATLSVTVWTFTALLLLNVHAWQPLGAVDAALAVVAAIALLSLLPIRTDRPA